jgi:2-keto-4-pentenoate hydratase/2-oxohepta-3-ene-1,7-dioic acid hydratase in catechol pathway
MKVARFIDAAQGIGHGLVQGDQILLISNAPPGSLGDWLALGPEVLKELFAGALRSGHRVPLASVRLLAPIQRPGKFLVIGLNYTSHIKEAEQLGLTFPETQIWCNKQPTSVTGPADDVVIPACSQQVDYEGELAVVVGRRCRNVPAERALEVVAGYMACNDVSARDVQLRSPTMMLGKSFDTHGPIGPWLVTPEEIADPQNLPLRTWVNGELRQDANTSQMRYGVREQIALLSSVFTLEPGDILATGTPAGVALAMRPPRYLTPGDIVRVEIGSIGAIENRFVVDNPRMRID